jgi:hypothetical protein
MMDKNIATIKGEELLEVCKTFMVNPELRVWENQGWHYAVESGTISLSAWPTRSGTTYSCLIGRGCSGDGIWSGPEFREHFINQGDPKAVVMAELKKAKRLWEEYRKERDSIIDDANNAILDEKED